jgi:hypothetical protein
MLMAKARGAGSARCCRRARMPASCVCCAAARVPADLVGGGALPAGGLGSGRPGPDLVARVEGGALPCVVHKGAEDDAMAAGGLWRSRLRLLWPRAAASSGLGRWRAYCVRTGGDKMSTGWCW